jgi:hypothetical protein
MTRHEQDRVHEPSGITFTFAGHLVWGNPKLSGGLHGDVESWRCGRCYALVVGEVAATDVHAEQHAQLDELAVSFTHVVDTIGKLAHGAFKPAEPERRVRKPKAEPAGTVRNPPATAVEMGLDAHRRARLAGWKDAATVREVSDDV